MNNLIIFICLLFHVLDSQPWPQSCTAHLRTRGFSWGSTQRWPGRGSGRCPCTWFPDIRGLHRTVLLEVPLLSPVGFPTLGSRTLLAWRLSLILSPYFCKHILQSFPEGYGRSLGFAFASYLVLMVVWGSCLGKKFPLDTYFLAPSVARSLIWCCFCPFSLGIFKRLFILDAA